MKKLYCLLGICLLGSTMLFAQNTTGNVTSEDSIVTDEKYYQLKEELRKTNENQRNLLLKMYASEWQTYRMAEQPHILHKKKQIEKKAKADGFTVEDLKAYLAEEKAKGKKK